MDMKAEFAKLKVGDIVIINWTTYNFDYKYAIIQTCNTKSMKALLVKEKLLSHEGYIGWNTYTYAPSDAPGDVSDIVINMLDNGAVRIPTNSKEKLEKIITHDILYNGKPIKWGRPSWFPYNGQPRTRSVYLD